MAVKASSPIIMLRKEHTELDEGNLTMMQWNPDKMLSPKLNVEPKGECRLHIMTFCLEPISCECS